MNFLSLVDVFADINEIKYTMLASYYIPVLQESYLYHLTILFLVFEMMFWLIIVFRDCRATTG